MCQTTDKGWIMKDGYVIPFEGDLNKIPPKYFSEIQEYSPSLYDMIRMGGDMKSVRHSLHEIRNMLQNHTNNCPINKPAVHQITKEIVEDIVQKKIDEYPKRRLESLSRYSTQWASVLDVLFKVSILIGAFYALFGDKLQ